MAWIHERGRFTCGFAKERGRSSGRWLSPLNAVRDLHSAVLSGFTYTAFSSEGQKAGLRQELLVINLLTDLHHHFRLSCKAQPVFPLCQISVLKGSKYT